MVPKSSKENFFPFFNLFSANVLSVSGTKHAWYNVTFYWLQDKLWNHYFSWYGEEKIEKESASFSFSFIQVFYKQFLKFCTLNLLRAMYHDGH